jgi:hypothetical protein
MIYAPVTQLTTSMNHPKEREQNGFGFLPYHPMVATIQPNTQKLEPCLNKQFTTLIAICLLYCCAVSTSKTLNPTLSIKHKVRTYIRRVPPCLSPRRNWDPPYPPPLPPVSVPSPPEPGRGAHSPGVEGVGESSFQRLQKKLSTLCTLCYQGSIVTLAGSKIESFKFLLLLKFVNLHSCSPICWVYCIMEKA